MPFLHGVHKFTHTKDVQTTNSNTTPGDHPSRFPWSSVEYVPPPPPVTGGKQLMPSRAGRTTPAANTQMQRVAGTSNLTLKDSNAQRVGNSVGLLNDTSCGSLTLPNDHFPLRLCWECNLHSLFCDGMSSTLVFAMKPLSDLELQLFTLSGNFHTLVGSIWEFDTLRTVNLVL